MIKLLFAMAIGAIIGYITNYIAIKMLFRPRKAVFLWGRQLPFTPGLIPKERGRIAESIGRVVSDKLLSADVLESALINDAMLEKARGMIHGAINSIIACEDTLNDAALNYISLDALDGFQASFTMGATDVIYRRLTSPAFSESVATALSGNLRKIIKGTPFGILGTLLDDNTMAGLSGVITDMISSFIRDNARDIVRSSIEREMDNLRQKRVCDTLGFLGDKREEIVEGILRGYVALVQHELPRVLSAIDLSAITRERIDAFDAVQLEELILGIMNRELKAIVNLGALLGAVIGALNAFIK